MSDGDELFEFDLENIRQELDLMEAGSRRGHLCSTCESITTVKDQLLLMAIAREWMNQQLRFAAAKQGFTEGLEQSVALLKLGLHPFSPSVAAEPVVPPMGPGAPSAN